MKPKYKRVILKVSGEALAGDNHFGINEAMLKKVARQIKEIHDLGVQVAVVVGGGNFWRGRSSENMDRATADYIGMLATVMNGLALQDAFEAEGMPTRVHTAIEMREVAEPYVRLKAISQLKKNKVVIFAAGTGNPFFSTDTTAALRAAEIDAEVILLAKNVDAVYSDDPVTNPDAVKYDSLTHREVLEKDLKVMDSTAASLCRDNNIDIHVFGIAEDGNVMKAVCGEKIGTIIT
ncbi:MAG: UMP kinase [Firmicutes bacterium]|nr:UMP kinase [Bacillota bacterium]MBQ1401345.1 UMP kinase [Bacillota bacterium]MDO4859898.1 UMP kinase [Bacillota bacterium]